MTIKVVATALLLNGLICAPTWARSGFAQQSTTQHRATSSAANPTSPKSVASKSSATAKKKVPAKPLVYINDSRSSKSSGASTSHNSRNSEVVKAFEQNCSSMALTDESAKANYQMTIEREPASKGVKTAFGLTNVVHKTDLVTVTSKSGKLLFSESGHSTTQLVDDACTMIASGTPAVNTAERSE